MSVRVVVAGFVVAAHILLPTPARGTTPDVRHFRVPDDVLAARATCHDAEARRIEREYATVMPDEAGYGAWRALYPDAAVAWHDALRACRHRHTQPGGIWNWTALTQEN